jgi:hypothetical protein
VVDWAAREVVKEAKKVLRSDCLAEWKADGGADEDMVCRLRSGWVFGCMVLPCILHCY